MEIPKVYFTEVHPGEDVNQIAERVTQLFEKANLAKCIKPNDLTAVKVHFGERGNVTSLKPGYIAPVVKAIRQCQAHPFLTDTCVLYRSIRDNAPSHLSFAHEQGFTFKNIGAPVVIADGLTGSDEVTVEIPGQIFKEVAIARTAREANSMIVVTHVTGHMVTGLGGAMKNLGMGFASRKGKLRQHATMKPRVSKKYCTGCEVCVTHCPVNAIEMVQGKAEIHSEICIGCGECVTVCRFDAIGHDWNRDSLELQKRMVEHALGVVIGKKERVGYFNFLLSITKDCDCITFPQKPLFPDIGILAGTDPVAMDAASLNLIQERTGKSLREWAYSHIDPWIQIAHGEAIGLGKAKYEWVQV